MKKSEYILIIVLGVLLIASIITIGVLWNRGDRKLLKYKEEQAIENIHFQDSVYNEANKKTKILEDSLVLVLNHAEKLNKKTEVIKTAILRDQKRMNDEIESIIDDAVDVITDSFNRKADRYTSPE